MATYSEDWFDKNIPVWEVILADLKDKPIKALEIGSFEGRSTVWLLENILTHEDSRIVCIDPYKNYRDLEKFSMNWEEIRQRFFDNTEPWKHKVKLWQSESSDVLRFLEDQFDFVYVDGGHESAQCLIDGVLSHLLLKPGGILIFDDYLWAKLSKAPNVPKSAIDAFMDCFSEQYDLISAGYQIALRKRTI